MSLTAGTATAGRIGVRSIGATATDATGGTGPYTYQWQFNWPRGCCRRDLQHASKSGLQSHA